MQNPSERDLWKKKTNHELGTNGRNKLFKMKGGRKHRGKIASPAKSAGFAMTSKIGSPRPCLFPNAGKERNTTSPPPTKNYLGFRGNFLYTRKATIAKMMNSAAMIIAVFRPVPASLWGWVTAGVVGLDGEGSGVLEGIAVAVRLSSGEGVSEGVNS